MDMDTEDMNDAISLLEEVVNSNIFDVKKINIEPYKIIKNANRKYIQSGGDKDKTEMSENNSVTNSSVTNSSVTNNSVTDSSVTDSSVTDSSITGDSMTIGHISVPSEIFVMYKKGKKIDTHSYNSSHYNLAFSNGSKSAKSDNDIEDIVDYKEKTQ